jgi:hypothetical protein
VIADLPAAGTAVSGMPLSPVTGAPAPKELIKLHCSSGNAERRGRWVVPSRMDLKVTSGGIPLDFAGAATTTQTLRIDAQARNGHITLITKPGIVVDMDDVTVRSGRQGARAVGSRRPRAATGWSTSRARAARHYHGPPPRRTLWQWLRRAPRPYAMAA